MPGCKNVLAGLACLFLFVGCMESEMPETSEFTVTDEKALGLAINNYILADSLSFSALDQQEFAAVQNYLNQRINFIGGVPTIDQTTFDWEVNVINDTTSIHAFTLPGGYIFVTQGLLEALESDAQLLGILAFQVVLADQGFALDRLQEAYGFGLLLDVALGRNSDVIEELVTILYSQPMDQLMTQVVEDRSIRLICPTEFEANGLAEMLSNLQDTRESLTEWERIYPGNGERVVRLNQFWEAEQCDGDLSGLESYSDFKALLP
ncbi:MAG: M48 family metalloprotease [Bacteroidota bacterium]